MNDPVVAVLDARGVHVDCFEEADESDTSEEGEGSLDAHEFRQFKEDPSGKEE